MSQIKRWELNIVSVIVLIAVFGLISSPAFAAATVNVTSGAVVVAGSFGNTITMTLFLSGKSGLNTGMSRLPTISSTA